MTRRAFVLRAADGAEIVCTEHEPAVAARSTIVFAPAGPLPRAGPFRSMTRLADRLCAAGHRVVRADLRGFGEAGADVPEAAMEEHDRRIERGLHVDDLRAVTAAVGDEAPLVLFGSCAGAVTALRAAGGDARVRAVVAYALPAVLTGGRGVVLEGRSGAGLALAKARLGLGEALVRGSRARLLPGGLAPWLNAPVIRALRTRSGDPPLLLLYGGEDVVQEHLARYGLDRLRGADIEELAGIGHQFDDPEDVERVAVVLCAWLARALRRQP